MANFRPLTIGEHLRYKPIFQDSLPHNLCEFLQKRVCPKDRLRSYSTFGHIFSPFPALHSHPSSLDWGNARNVVGSGDKLDGGIILQCGDEYCHMGHKFWTVALPTEESDAKAMVGVQWRGSMMKTPLKCSYM